MSAVARWSRDVVTGAVAVESEEPQTEEISLESEERPEESVAEEHGTFPLFLGRVCRLRLRTRVPG